MKKYLGLLVYCCAVFTVHAQDHEQKNESLFDQVQLRKLLQNSQEVSDELANSKVVQSIDFGLYDTIGSLRDLHKNRYWQMQLASGIPVVCCPSVGGKKKQVIILNQDQLQACDRYQAYLQQKALYKEELLSKNPLVSFYSSFRRSFNKHAPKGCASSPDYEEAIRMYLTYCPDGNCSNVKGRLLNKNFATKYKPEIFGDKCSWFVGDNVGYMSKEEQAEYADTIRECLGKSKVKE